MHYLLLFAGSIRKGLVKKKKKGGKYFIWVVGPPNAHAIGHLRLGFTVLSLPYWCQVAKTAIKPPN